MDPDDAEALDAIDPGDAENVISLHDSSLAASKGDEEDEEEEEEEGRR